MTSCTTVTGCWRNQCIVYLVFLRTVTASCVVGLVHTEKDMAQKRTSPAKAAIPTGTAVTAVRFVRLYRMVKLLAGGTQSRETLTRRLRLDVRGFYRDLGLLRSSGALIALVGGRYTLEQDVDDALALLPFPNPQLTLGSAKTLAKGRRPAHRALAETITQIVPTR